MSKNQAISLRSQWLGARLKIARTRAGVTLEEVASQLQIADTTLSRFEKGTLRIRRPYVKEMIDVYGISNQRERLALLQLNEDAWRKDWWDGDTSDLEMGFLDYTWLESRATTIYHFANLVPGLLQTRDYARAVMKASALETEQLANIDRHLELRGNRQSILHTSSPTSLSVVLDESAIRRPIGGSQIMRAQLSHLVQSASMPHMDIRVRLTRKGWAPGLSSAFTLFEMPDPYPEVAYVDNLAGQTFLEENTKVQRFKLAYDELYQTSLGPTKSVELMRAVAKDLE